jgi:hypothetical protein
VVDQLDPPAPRHMTGKTRGRRKSPPKYDHAAINQMHVARPPTEAQARTRTQAWLAVPENIDRLLETVTCGQSLRRFCEQEEIAYSPVQRALMTDALRPRYYAAQEEQAEHLLGEMERVTQRIESGDLEPKAGAVVLDSIKWRLSKFNARRYSDRQVIEQHTFDHTKAHVEAVRALARMPTTARIVAPEQQPAALLSNYRDSSDIIDVQVELLEPVVPSDTVGN